MLTVLEQRSAPTAFGTETTGERASFSRAQMDSGAVAGETRILAIGVEERPSEEIVLVPAPPAKPDDGFVPTNKATQQQESPTSLGQPNPATRDAVFAQMSSRFVSPLSKPPQPPLLPQTNMGGGGGAARSGASTPNAGGGGGGPTGGGGGPGMVNANTFLGYSLGGAGNVPNVGRASQPAPHAASPPTAFDMPSAMTPPTPSLLPYNPMTAATPSGHGHGPNRGSDPMYVLDLNNGETIPANVTLNTFSTWSENLLAQVSGVTVNNYSWNLTQAPDLTNVSGATTANLKGTWANFSGTTRTDTISVTETPTAGQPITVTMTFAVAGTNSPAFSSSRPTTSSTWPTVIAPDQISSSQATQAAGPYASIGLTDGSVQTSFSMPSYNRNTTPVSLYYNSTTANAQPIFLTEYQLPVGQSVPSTITAQLTFNNTPLASVSYNTSGLNPGDIMQIALQANAATLNTGRYPWSVVVTDGSNKSTYSGSVDIVNQDNCPFGAGWSLDNVEQLCPVTGGVILVEPGGTSLWFASNVSGGFTTPPGDFSTLTLSNGIYTQTLTDGTQIHFNSSGQETSRVDRDGNTTSFGYTSGLLTSITDMNNQVTTLAYNSSNLLSTITDPANRTATLTYTGNQLTSIDDPGNDLWQYSYNSANDLTKLTDPDNHTTTFTYNTADRVSSITQPDSTTEQLMPMQMNGYAAAGSSNVAAVLLATGDQALFTDANGNVWTDGMDWLGYGQDVADIDPLGDASLDYIDANGLFWMLSDALSRRTREFFGSNGIPTEIVQPDNSYSQYQYNNFSEVTRYTDPTGDITTYSYNSKGDLTEETNALNYSTTYAYNSAGLVTSTTDPLGNATTNSYNSLNELTGTTNALNQTTTYAYNNAGLVTSTTDAMGYVTTYSYDALNRKTGETLPDSSTTYSAYSYAYDKVGNQTSVTDPLDHITTYSYNAVNEMTAMTNALNQVTSYGYDNDSNQVGVTNPLDQTTTYSYNAANELTGVTNALNQTTTCGYDAAGEKISETNPLSQTTTYGYTSLGQIASITNPLGDVTSYAYDPAGDVISITQTGTGQQDQTTNLGYNAVHQEVNSTDPLHNQTTYSYDADGNIITATNPLQLTTTYTYNAINELVGVTDPMKYQTTYTYNANGNQTTVTNPLGQTTSYTYDAQSRALTEKAPDGGVTTYKYDLAGNLQSLTDPDNNTTSYSYNAINEMVSTTNPLGYQSTYAYNAAGLLTSTTDADGRTIDYGYNAVGEETSETWVGGNYNATYQYNAAGELTNTSDPLSTYSYTYDAAGRETSVSNAGTPGVPTVALSYGYDVYGNRTSLSDSLGGSISYSYDQRNLLTGLSLTVNGTNVASMGFGYNQAELLTSITRVNGSISTSLTYDNDNRLTGIYNTKSSSMTLANYLDDYNAAGEVTSYQDSNNSSLSYGYNANGELTSASGTLNGSSYSVSYSYDANGDRTMSGYQTATGNELLSDGTSSYTYDKDGSMVTQTNIATGSVTYYTWDYRNRLTEVKEEASNGTVINDEKFTYDVNNNRIGASLNGTQQLYTVYDGSNSYMDFSVSGQLTERYLLSPALQMSLASVAA